MASDRTESPATTTSEPVASILSSPKGKAPGEKGGKWVRFDGDTSTSTDINDPAEPAQISVTVENGTPERNKLGEESKGYANGTKLWEATPENAYCPWLVPARFNPLDLPKIAYYKLKIPVEDFVTSMEMLTNDFRFRSYVILYRRLIAMWLVFMFVILVIILVSQVTEKLVTFGVVIFWMFLLAVGILGVLYVKKQMHKALHRCVGSVNGLLSRHRLLVAVEDRGKLSCHKISIHFIYFDTAECRLRLAQLLRQQKQLRAVEGGSTAAAPVASVDGELAADAQKEQARLLLLKYSQSYGKALVRKRLRFPSTPSQGVSEFAPLHAPAALCLCQYIQRYHFEKKGQKNCCEKIFLVGDQNIADLEAPVYGAGAYPPPPPMAYATM